MVIIIVDGNHFLFCDRDTNHFYIYNRVNHDNFVTNITISRSCQSYFAISSLLADKVISTREIKGGKIVWKRQEKWLVIVSFFVAFIMLLSIVGRLFS